MVDIGEGSICGGGRLGSFYYISIIVDGELQTNANVTPRAGLESKSLPYQGEHPNIRLIRISDSVNTLTTSGKYI